MAVIPVDKEEIKKAPTTQLENALSTFINFNRSLKIDKGESARHNIVLELSRRRSEPLP